MSAVVITFDTESKQLGVTIDGTPVANITEIDFYSSYDRPDEYRMGICQSEHDAISDIRTYTRLMASVNDGFGVESPAFPGFVVEPAVDNAMMREVAAFFGVKE